MKYPLHDLNDDDFENLSTTLCRKLFGEGVIPFSKGPDGGRDGRFHGKANSFPSEAEPWNGKTVIQAKHTIKENSSCSDQDFQKILENEVLPAIERLKKENKIDFYLLFTNRKLSGKQDEKIEDLIDKKTELPNIIIANEKIQQWLNSYPEIVRELKLHDLLRPLQFDESDLKHLIEIFHGFISKDISDHSKVDFNYIEMGRKNELNNLSKEYFNEVIKKHYSHFESISDFLKNPINSKLKSIFDDLVDEMNAKITIYRPNYSSFENLLDELYNYVVSNNAEFAASGKKKLVRIFINYMYCNCFIGRKENA